ncbi:MAG: DUF5666 domain-containing protein [Blastocatellia bacterium]|nr:DUF5666 domain-containing protein [Blastocatellia bacterium]
MMMRSLRTNRGVFAVMFGVVVLALSLLGAGSAGAAFDGNDNGNRAEIIGPIMSLPTTADFTGEWTVGRTKVAVTKDTKIDQERGKPVVGAVVEVNGVRGQNGVITAKEIEIRLSPAGGLPIKFTGKIEELPSTAGRVGDWKVSGKVIHVSASTEIEQERGQVAVGATVEIEGLVQTDGSINALEIEVKPEAGSGLAVKFLGKVEKLPSTTGRIGDWVISGRTVRVSASTQLKTERGDFMVGSLVDVEGLAQVDGAINATKIENRGNIENPQITVYFRGTIETLPTTATFIGDWKVSGRTVRVNDRTVLIQEKGKIAVGAFIEVSGVLQADGSVLAAKVAVRENPNPPGFVKFVGKIVTLPGTTNFIGDWKIGERTVHVTAATKIEARDGQVAVGALVEVEGTLRSDGSVDASEIEVKHNSNDTANYIRLFGTISALPATANLVGDWTVGGRTIHVFERTRIRTEHGRPVVGAYVEVEGNQRADNTIDAYNIEVERDAGAPAGTIGFINFYGQIKGLPTAANFIGDWTVGTRKVTVTDTTRIETRRGAVAVNAFVEIYGYLLGDGSVRAIKIEVRPVPSTGNAAINRSYVEIIGKIEKLPDDKNYIGVWTVGGRTVNVKERTVIRRERAVVAVGATVEIYGAELANGEVDAKFIEVEHGPAGASFQSYAPLASVSAGSYQEANTASAIIASFGSNLAPSAMSATKLPLPTSLGGVSVLIDGRPAGLFFVSPNQINYQVPDGMLPGAAQVAVVRNGNVVAQGTLSLDDVAPNLFTANASGQGVPAGTLLRVKANGQQVYEPLARLEAGKFVPVTISRLPGERLFLVLFGSGLRGASDADGNAANGVAEHVQVTIGGVNAPVIFAGAAPGFAGLDQFNVEIPANASGANLSVVVKVSNGEGKVMPANAVSISIR